MPHYEVSITVDVEADNPVQAAINADAQIREPYEWVFEVKDTKTGEKHTFDLEYERPED
jgi:hypothetical protein